MSKCKHCGKDMSGGLAPISRKDIHALLVAQGFEDCRSLEDAIMWRFGTRMKKVVIKRSIQVFKNDL